MFKKRGFSLIELLIVLGVIAAMSIGGFFLFSKVSSENNINTAVRNLNLIQSELESKNYTNYANYVVGDDVISFHYDIKKNQIIKIDDEYQRGSNVYQITAYTKDGSYSIFMSSQAGLDSEMENVCANFAYDQYRKKEFKQLMTVTLSINASNPSQMEKKYTLSDFFNACNNDMKMPVLSINY